MIYKHVPGEGDELRYRDIDVYPRMQWFITWECGQCGDKYSNDFIAHRLDKIPEGWRTGTHCIYCHIPMQITMIREYTIHYQSNAMTRADFGAIIYKREEVEQ